jgi:tetratricopeptide (TPR) repeat protein
MKSNLRVVIPIYSLLVLCCFVGHSAAEPLQQDADWAKIEQQLYSTIKSEQPGKSEAEIEEAIGHALLSSDNQWQRAVVHLKKSVELDPKRYVAWYDLALINMGSEEGNGYFKKSTEANPNFAPSWYWLGYNSVRDGKDSEAVDYFEHYLKVASGEEETGRIKVATAVLEELRSGKPGPETAKIRPLGVTTDAG